MCEFTSLTRNTCSCYAEVFSDSCIATYIQGYSESYILKGATAPKLTLPCMILHSQVPPDGSTPQTRTLQLANTVNSFVGRSVISLVPGNVMRSPSFLPAGVLLPRQKERMNHKHLVPRAAQGLPCSRSAIHPKRGLSLSHTWGLSHVVACVQSPVTPHLP